MPWVANPCGSIFSYSLEYQAHSKLKIMNVALFMKKFFYNSILERNPWNCEIFASCKAVFWAKLPEVSYGAHSVLWPSAALVLAGCIRIMCLTNPTMYKLSCDLQRDPKDVLRLVPERCYRKWLAGLIRSSVWGFLKHKERLS